MSQAPSSWLKVWELIDLEWQRIERALLALLVVLVLIAVCLRFGYSMLGMSASVASSELLQAAMLWLVMLSASLSLTESARPAAAPEGQSAARLWTLLLTLIAALVCLLLAISGLRFMALDLQLGSSSPLGLPGLWLLLPLPLMFLIMALRLMRYSLQRLG